MSPLKWHSIGLAEWSAWSTDDGQFAPATALIAKTHLGYRVGIRSNQTYDEVAALHLNHQAFTLDDAQFFANLLLAQSLPLEQIAEVDSAIVQARLQARSEPSRCRYVHAFTAGAGDSAVCQCGRVTKGLLKQSKAS